MGNDTELTEAGRQYAAAYAAHYTDHDLRAALQLYTKIVASHPGTQEAGYSRAQLRNILNSIVPEQELLDAQIELAHVHLEHQGRPDAKRLAVGPLVPEVAT